MKTRTANRSEQFTHSAALTKMTRASILTFFHSVANKNRMQNGKLQADHLLKKKQTGGHNNINIEELKQKYRFGMISYMYRLVGVGG